MCVHGCYDLQIQRTQCGEMCDQHAGPPLKVQQMVERGTPLGIDPTLLLLHGLNFGVEHLYLDPSPNNEAGAAYFICGPPGAEQALLCQVNLAQHARFCSLLRRLPLKQLFR